MTRATKADLAQRLGFLRDTLDRLGIPLADLGIECWSPGDGVSRYRLIDNGGSNNVTPYFSGVGAFHDAIDLAVSVLQCAMWRNRSQEGEA